MRKARVDRWENSEKSKSESLMEEFHKCKEPLCRTPISMAIISDRLLFEGSEFSLIWHGLDIPTVW